MVDASAIDSTVLETELANRPEIACQIRVIESLGPSPIPPWVVHHSLPETLRTALRETLLDMARDPLGQDLLAQGRLVRFTSVTDAGYDPIRVMLKEAEGVEL
jgi:phosphonate transport system substrate-binding protein